MAGIVADPAAPAPKRSRPPGRRPPRQQSRVPPPPATLPGRHLGNSRGATGISVATRTRRDDRLSGTLRLGRRPAWLGAAFRWSMWLDPWAMLDVYLLAGCVGYYRLMNIDQARITIELGGACFIAAAFLTMLSRATLERLQTVPGAARPTGPRRSADGLPQIPVASGNGITSLVARINRIPIEHIARNALDITQHVDELTSSPRLRDAIVQLDAALRQIHRTTARAGPQIGPLIADLRRAAGDLDATAKSANRMVSGTTTQGGLTQTAQEIAEAARAVRSLADYLDRHPAALIRGRGGDSP